MTQRQAVPAAETKPPGPPEGTQVGSRASSRGFRASQGRSIVPCRAEPDGDRAGDGTEEHCEGTQPWFIAQGGDSASTLPTPHTTRALNALVSLPCSLHPAGMS